MEKILNNLQKKLNELEEKVGNFKIVTVADEINQNRLYNKIDNAGSHLLYCEVWNDFSKLEDIKKYIKGIEAEVNKQL